LGFGFLEEEELFVLNAIREGTGVALGSSREEEEEEEEEVCRSSTLTRPEEIFRSRC
jgi:hypothetical protein